MRITEATFKLDHFKLCDFELDDFELDDPKLNYLNRTGLNRTGLNRTMVLSRSLSLRGYLTLGNGRLRFALLLWFDLFGT